jgi:hypothetical protein
VTACLGALGALVACFSQFLQVGNSTCGTSMLAFLRSPHSLHTNSPRPSLSSVGLSADQNIMMGWWKPYFFFNPSGVQLLVPGFALDSVTSYVFGALAIAALSITDRTLSRMAMRSAKVASSHAGDSHSALLFTAQRFTGGLVMLLMMTFNFWIFIWTVLSLGLGEKLSLWSERRAAATEGRAQRWQHEVIS